MRQPVAYIRRSVARRGDPGDVSREFQTGAVRKLAGADGAVLRVVDGDWGKSAGTDKTSSRTAFLELLEDVEAGRVSHVYAYSPDRLARSVEWSARLVNACRRAEVAITTTAGTVLPGDPGARMLFNMLAVMNENTLEEMERKAQAAAATVRARGTHTGGRAYGEVWTLVLRRGEIVQRVVGEGEDPAVVMAAFREAGSYFGAALLLNQRDVPARSGGRWYARTVQRIVNHQDPTTVRRVSRRGSRATLPNHRLAALLRCHCGTLLGQTVSGEGTPRYRCSTAAADPSHARPYIVSERQLLPWIKAEVDHLRLDVDQVAMVTGAAAQRATLAARLNRANELYIDGRIDRDRYDAIAAEVAAETATLPGPEDVVDVSPMTADEWATWSPADVATYLHAIISEVRLGVDMRPVEAVWRNRALRGA